MLMIEHNEMERNTNIIHDTTVSLMMDLILTKHCDMR